MAKPRPSAGAKRGRKRTEAQREADLVIVAAGLRAGRDFYEIAEEITKQRPYDITHWQIRDDAKAIIERWRDSHLWEIESMKLMELTRINRIEAQAWAAWERSQQNYAHATKTAKTMIPRGGGKNGAAAKPAVVAEVHSQRSGTRVGDPRFLELVKSCVEARIRLFALAPKEPDEPAGSGAIGVTMIFNSGKSAEELTKFPVKRLSDKQVKEVKREDETEFLDEPEDDEEA